MTAQQTHTHTYKKTTKLVGVSLSGPAARPPGLDGGAAHLLTSRGGNSHLVLLRQKTLWWGGGRGSGRISKDQTAGVDH